MPDPRSSSLYTQIGIRDFATSTEIAQRLFETGDDESEELQTAIEILTDYSLKNAYDMVLEAWSNSDRLLPRFATPEAANVVIDVASRVGFELKEIHTNTFQVRATAATDVLDENEPAGEDQELEIKVGNRQLIFEATRFVAHRDRYNQKIVLELISAESSSLLFIPDTIVQKDTNSGDKGILIQLKQFEVQTEPVSFAILNQSQGLSSPLAAGGRFLFSKSRKTIADSFQIRDSQERVQQLIRTYYRDLAGLILKFDSRIGRNVTLKSFLKYFEQYHS